MTVAALPPGTGVAAAGARARRSGQGAARPDPRCVGWHLYFPDEPYDDLFPYKERIRNLKEYFMTKPDLFAQNSLELGTVSVNYQDLEKSFSDPSSQELPLSDDIRDQPELVLKCMSLAFYQALIAIRQMQDSTYTSAERIDVRLANFTPVTPLRRLKANYIGKFVAVKGTVVRVSNIKPLVTQMLFRCARCGDGSQVVSLPDGKFVAPTSCNTEGCRSRSFLPDRLSPETKTIDFQTIRVQEIMQDDQRESGRIPRTVDCELLNDLVDSCVPGDVVTVSGEVKVVSADSGPDKGLFLIYISANGIHNLRKPQDISSANGDGDDVIDEHTTHDLYLIQEIQKQEDIFRLIVHSMCPTIYGQELVKAGLALALFGGCQRYMDDRNTVPLRGDPHVLVVGDPGLGKSQMLQHLSTLTPRGVYVCGNTTSNAGLTVSLHKDPISGDYALEAGALVLGDQGCCCIDEFDKMANQHQALLEAMEQQSISIAKAGIVCSLPARTSIVAAANPVGGHYNKARTVSENLKMGSALLSRFDLVFILLDEANEERDRMLSEHVMALHSAKRSSHAQNSASAQQFSSQIPSQFLTGGPLMERLILKPNEVIDPLFPQQLRKYVAYARKYVHPRLTEQAARVLQEFYLDLRQRHQGADTTPVTTRQLESLIRLAEARARSELREVVVEQDALDVIDIMRVSLYDTFCDEFGHADIQPRPSGSGMSKTQQAKLFVSRLNQIAEETYNSLFSKQQLKEIADELNLDVGSFEAFLSSLNNEGYLLKRGPRSYQLRTVDM